MPAVILILLGIMLFYTGLTGKTEAVVSAFVGESLAGYNKINFSQFLLGGFIVTLPLLAIKREDWKNGYVLLILISFAVFNYKGLQKFTNYVSNVIG